MACRYKKTLVAQGFLVFLQWSERLLVAFEQALRCVIRFRFPFFRADKADGYRDNVFWVDGARNRSRKHDGNSRHADGEREPVELFDEMLVAFGGFRHEYLRG